MLTHLYQRFSMIFSCVGPRRYRKRTSGHRQFRLSALQRIVDVVARLVELQRAGVLHALLVFERLVEMSTVNHGLIDIKSRFADF